MVSRRRFVSDTVIFALVPAVSGCGDDDDDQNAAGCDGAGATSSVDGGHTHDVCVGSADLMSPPASGGRYTTTNVEGHTHEVGLSAAELAQLAGGGTVTVMATVVQSHGHTFTLKK